MSVWGITCVTQSADRQGGLAKTNYFDLMNKWQQELDLNTLCSHTQIPDNTLMQRVPATIFVLTAIHDRLRGPQRSKGCLWPFPDNSSAPLPVCETQTHSSHFHTHGEIFHFTFITLFHQEMSQGRSITQISFANTRKCKYGVMQICDCTVCAFVWYFSLRAFTSRHLCAAVGTCITGQFSFFSISISLSFSSSSPPISIYLYFCAQWASLPFLAGINTYLLSTDVYDI